MTVKRIVVNLDDFKSGKLAYFTKNFSTYYVRYVGSDEKSVKVKVVKHIFLHERAMERCGVKTTYIYHEGRILDINPSKLWELQRNREKRTLFSYIINLIRRETY